MLIGELKKLAKALNKDFKYEIAVAGPDPNMSDAGGKRIPSSSFMLNLLLEGGIPLGRIIEIFGDESVGKSTIMQHMMIGFQQSGGISILLDAETGWHRKRAIAMGHKPDSHLHLQADTVEVGGKALLSVIDKLSMPGVLPSFTPIGIFWDTISSSQTEGEKKGDLYMDGIADKARKIRQMLRTISPILPKVNASLVFVSQTIMEIKKGSGSPPRKISASGGNALRFWASKRLKVWREGPPLPYPVDNSGIMVVVKNIKDKMDPPNREVCLPIMYDSGIHPGYELVVFLLDSSTYVNKDGNRVCVPDYPEPGDSISFYMKQLPEILEKYPDLIDYLADCARSAWCGTL